MKEIRVEDYRAVLAIWNSRGAHILALQERFNHVALIRDRTGADSAARFKATEISSNFNIDYSQVSFCVFRKNMHLN